MTHFAYKSIFSLIPALVASLAAGCVVQPAAGAPPASPAPPKTGTPQAPAAGCALDAPVLYEIASAAVQTPDEPYRRLRILDSGAWLLSENGTRSTGCLGDAPATELRANLAQVDFTPPPPPEMTCAAVPTTSVTVTDQQGRQATFTTPCGRPASESVHALVQETEARIRAAAEAPASPDQTPMCINDGADPIYHETRWGLQATSGQGTPDMEIAVYPSGAWRYQAGAETRSGCLGQDTVTDLRSHIDSIEVKVQAVTGIRCKALPTHRNELVTGSGKVAWEAPCGATEPHLSTANLQQAVHRAVGI